MPTRATAERDSSLPRHRSFRHSSFAEGVMTAYGTLPNWVTKRDGRLVPFDGDRVCRAVFAAGERVGRPDPFLARELTDGVLHFLAEDGADDPLPTDRLAEVVITIVRELGHPALAQSFLEYRT